MRATGSLLAIVLCLATLGGPALADDPQQTLRELEAGDNSDPRAWRALAGEAREAGDLELAGKALDRAEELGLPAIPVAVERARQLVLKGNTGAAVAKLQEVVDAGFTGLDAITGDPVLGELAGNPAFDTLVAGMEEAAYPCAHQDRFREFDFWLGHWDVHTANGTFAGTNHIHAEERGCVLIEEWQSATGGTGRSINYLDTASGEWVQVWNDASGTQIDIRGGMTEDGMRLSGRIHYVGNGTTAPFRGTWTPLPDGRVRQYFEQSNDGGESWTAWFEGFYSRRESSD